MAAWACVECSTTFSVGAPRCPHCGSTEHLEEGAMPKITVHGGPSVAGASVVGGAWSDEGDPDVWPEPAEDEEGSEESSPESSPETPSTDTESSKKPSRAPARTTGSRSKKTQTAAAQDTE